MLICLSDTTSTSSSTPVMAMGGNKYPQSSQVSFTISIKHYHQLTTKTHSTVSLATTASTITTPDVPHCYHHHHHCGHPCHITTQRPQQWQWWWQWRHPRALVVPVPNCSFSYVCHFPCHLGPERMYNYSYMRSTNYIYFTGDYYLLSTTRHLFRASTHLWHTIQPFFCI